MKKKRRSPILLWALLAILVVVLILVIVLTVNSRPKAGPQEPSSQISSQESTPVSSDPIAPSSQESPSALPSSSQSTSETIDASDPYLRLVNVDNPLPDDFEAETKVADNGLSLEVKAADALIDMFEDARQDGVRLVLTSGYRSVARQRVLFDNKVQEYKNQGYSDAEAEKAASLLVDVYKRQPSPAGQSLTCLAIC